MSVTFLELFAGGGGLSRGLELAGWHCVGHAEIEPHARAVLRHQWPDTPLLGDVTAINGADFAGITLLSGGSPCQDLSVAGKRAGMVEDSGTRSSLYFEQVRIWRESEAPYFLWENVLGAFSSNNGRDFAAVLSALVGAPVPVPDDGWGGAGVASGPTGVAAWRVLDCQYFGPPQRRRRVFVLCSRTGGVDPAAVLSLSESLCRHPQASGEAREGTPASTGSGAPSGDDETVAIRTAQTSANGHGIAVGVSHTLDGAQGQAVLAFGGQNSAAQGDSVTDAITPSLDKSKVPNVLAFAQNQSHANGGGQVAVCVTQFGEVAGSLTARHDSSPCADRGQNVVFTLDKQSAQVKGGEVSPTLKTDLAHDMGPVVTVHDARGNGAGSVDTTLPGDHLNRVTDYTPIIMSSGQSNAELVRDGEPSLTTLHEAPIVFPTIAASDGDKWGCNQWVTEGKAIDDGLPTPASAVNVSDGVATLQDTMGTLGARSGGSEVGAQTRGVENNAPTTGRPRRLMPVECERLMGWSDGSTAHGVNEAGKLYELSDSARYKICGNGVASPVVAWIAFRLRDALAGRVAEPEGHPR